MTLNQWKNFYKNDFKKTSIDDDEVIYNILIDWEKDRSILEKEIIEYKIMANSINLQTIKNLNDINNALKRITG